MFARGFHDDHVRDRTNDGKIPGERRRKRIRRENRRRLTRTQRKRERTNRDRVSGSDEVLVQPRLAAGRFENQTAKLQS